MTPITRAALGTYIRALSAIFTTTVLGAYLSSGKDIFSVTLTDWKTYAAAGIGAIVPVVIRFLNINDQAYGLVKVEETAKKK
jgi:hypothetical protein